MVDEVNPCGERNDVEVVFQNEEMFIEGIGLDITVSL